MMIRVQWIESGGVVTADISLGLKGKTASYDVQRRGTLKMSTAEWKLFKQTLDRGAGKGVIVMIEGGVSDEKSAPTAAPAELSPF